MEVRLPSVDINQATNLASFPAIINMYQVYLLEALQDLLHVRKLAGVGGEGKFHLYATDCVRFHLRTCRRTYTATGCSRVHSLF